MRKGAKPEADDVMAVFDLMLAMLEELAQYEIGYAWAGTATRGAFGGQTAASRQPTTARVIPTSLRQSVQTRAGSTPAGINRNRSLNHEQGATPGPVMGGIEDGDY